MEGMEKDTSGEADITGASREAEMNLHSKGGISLLHALLYAAVTVIVLNMTCVMYVKSLSLMRFISGRCEDLQGLDLILRDVKRDVAGASGAEVAQGKLVLRMPGNRTVSYDFAEGTLSRNGVAYHPNLEAFTTSRVGTDLVGIHIQLPSRGRRTGPVVSTVILMRNVHETAEE
jgi:hypothetical protein